MATASDDFQEYHGGAGGVLDIVDTRRPLLGKGFERAIYIVENPKEEFQPG